MDTDFTSSSFEDHPSQFSPPHRIDGSCPACSSIRIVTRYLGRKVCGVIGSIAGAAVGITGTLSGVLLDAAGLGTALSVGASQSIARLSVIASAVLSGIGGGIAGCAVGASLGEAIDESILRNRRCAACGHTFSVPRS